MCCLVGNFFGVLIFVTSVGVLVFLDFESRHLGMGMGWSDGGSQEGGKQRALPTGNGGRG